MGKIPTIVNMFNVYDTAAKRLIGISDTVSLPDWDQISETLSGPGILGEIDFGAIGHFSNQTFEIPFRSYDGDFFKFIDPSGVVGLTLRAGLQSVDESGNQVPIGTRIVVRGNFAGFSGGSVKQGESMKPSVSINLQYLLFVWDGQEKIELDKLHGVYKVNGKDVIAEYKALC